MVREKDDKFLKIQIFVHNSAPNYSTVENSYMRKQDLKTKKHFVDFGIFDLKAENKFRKKQIFKRNSARNYFIATKFLIKRLDINTKKTSFDDFGIFHF